MPVRVTASKQTSETYTASVPVTAQQGTGTVLFEVSLAFSVGEEPRLERAYIFPFLVVTGGWRSPVALTPERFNAANVALSPEGSLVGLSSEVVVERLVEGYCRMHSAEYGWRLA